jgi:hypothetical protein
MSASSPESAAELWASDGGERARDALAKGISAMAGMIVMDLEVSRAMYQDKSLKREQGPSETLDGVKGTLVSQDAELVILRRPDGALHAASNM